jgi:glycosyltransferase involved in cell wall biosynthesis
VYCVSDAVRDALLANCAFPQRKVSTVRNGVDADRFRPNEDWRKKWRAALGVSDDTLVFGSVGRLVPEKAYDTIIRLFASLAGEMPGTPMRLVLVGTGPEEEALRGVARTSGAGHLVAFFGFSECPWEVICAFDVFLLLSRTEGLGLSLCEAMACECFCIASATGGMPEVISERSVGWLVPPEDEKAILEAMRATVRMPTGERREIGRSARKHMVANFNEAAQMANLADLLCRTNIA